VARRLVDDIRVDGVAAPGRYQDLHAAYLTFRGQISTARLRGSAWMSDTEERQRSNVEPLSPQQVGLTSLRETLQRVGPDRWLR
jgi:hypothetical protein